MTRNGTYQFYDFYNFVSYVNSSFEFTFDTSSVLSQPYLILPWITPTHNAIICSVNHGIKNKLFPCLAPKKSITETTIETTQPTTTENVWNFCIQNMVCTNIIWKFGRCSSKIKLAMPISILSYQGQGRLLRWVTTSKLSKI